MRRDGQSCRCTVHIQVCLHNASVCSGIFEADGDGKARNNFLSMQRFYFIVTLVTIERVLQSLLSLKQNYKSNNVTSWRQQKKQSLSSPSYSKRGQVQRCGIRYMKALWTWQQYSKFNRTSHAGKQRHREKVPADTPYQYWNMAVQVDLPFMDHCCRKLTHDC